MKSSIKCVEKLRQRIIDICYKLILCSLKKFRIDRKINKAVMGRIMSIALLLYLNIHVRLSVTVNNNYLNIRELYKSNTSGRLIKAHLLWTTTLIY